MKTIRLPALRMPDGTTQVVNLSGPMTQVGPVGPVGEANDSNGNGLDGVDAELVQMELAGNSPLGPVRVFLAEPRPDPLGPIRQPLQDGKRCVILDPTVMHGFFRLIWRTP